VTAGYWSWWHGALVLGAITSCHWFFVRRPLSASGLVGRAVELRRELGADACPAAAQDARIREALLRATADEFGEAALAAAAAAAPGPSRPGRPLGPPLAISEVLVFLACLAAGGFAARLQTGAPPDLGPEFVRAFGEGWPARAVLCGGGALVGAGTSLAQGCSVGHGLSGLARLQPGSLVAMTLYVGAGVLVALLVGSLA